MHEHIYLMHLDAHNIMHINGDILYNPPGALMFAYLVH